MHGLDPGGKIQKLPEPKRRSASEIYPDAKTKARANSERKFCFLANLFEPNRCCEAKRIIANAALCLGRKDVDFSFRASHLIPARKDSTLLLSCRLSKTKPDVDLSLLRSGYRLSFIPWSSTMEWTFNRTLVPFLTRISLGENSYFLEVTSMT